MKRFFTIAFTLLVMASCSDNEHLSCSGEIVQSNLKQIYTDAFEEMNVNPRYNIDTTSWTVLAIRTLSKNKEFHSCECRAQVGRTKNDTLYLSNGYGRQFPLPLPLYDDIEYTVQLTDDGKSVSVSIH